MSLIGEGHVLDRRPHPRSRGHVVLGKELVDLELARHDAFPALNHADLRLNRAP